MNKNCSVCVYQDGVRADGTIKCTDTARQRDSSITDCCIAVKPLRALQAKAPIAEYGFVTNSYVEKQKMQSAYWRKIIKNTSREYNQE